MNSITSLFGIQYPIIQGGMVWNSGYKLASAVSNAGGLGLIGAGSMHPETFREHIQKCKKETSKPFGVNIPMLYPEIETLLQITIEEGVKIVFTSAGNPKTWTTYLKNSGIIKTDLAQRLSLFIPIIAAILVFNEPISTLKYIGLAIGLLAVYFILDKKKSENQVGNSKFSWYLLLVFLGYGTVDVLFKKVALVTEIPYTTSLFFIFLTALIISLFFNVLALIKNGKNLNVNNLYFGVPLGVLNFFNIYFYLKAHAVFSESPTTVFAGMNFGVILFGTLVGWYLFNEKLSFKNKIGLLFAVFAISLIVISQIL